MGGLTLTSLGSRSGDEAVKELLLLYFVTFDKLSIS